MKIELDLPQYVVFALVEYAQAQGMSVSELAAQILAERLAPNESDKTEK